MPENPKEKTVQITSLSPKGRGIALDSNIEVIGALPNENVRVELGPKSRKKRLAFLRELIGKSIDRVEPKCSHSPQCGGCSLQQMDYSAQLDHKEALIGELFAEWIVEHQTEVRPILGCENPWQYRNKMEFSFSENRAGERFLGLMLAGSRGRVFNLTECYLVSTWYANLLEAVRIWWKKNDLKAYHHSSDGGHLRTLTVREAKQGKGKMVMLTVSGNPDFALKKSQMKSFVEAIKECTPEEGLSIFLQVQQIAKGRPTQFFEMLLNGPDHITEVLNVELHGKEHRMEFKISPTSFFQPNTLQAERLYSEGLGMLSQLKGSIVFDLYCGGATLGLSAAKLAKKVVGIEINPHSVFDAGWNQEVNHIENFSIERGDVGKILTKWKEEGDFVPPDIVILDPPRMGLDAAALQNVISIGAKEILYISCNPKTQAANVKDLIDAGYQLKIIQSVDQFPHTVHIENICLLSKD